jgi:hypothetical protein
VVRCKSQYKIDELAQIVHPLAAHRKIFVMLHAYLDESGIHSGAEVCVIAGYFAGRGKWKKFESDWRSLLADFRVPMEKFHSKDLFPKPKGFFHPAESDWGGDWESFLDGIAEVVSRHEKIHPISAAIFVEHFNSFSLEERRYLTGGTFRKGKVASSGCPSKPYFVPFQQVVVTVSQ